MKNRTRNYIFVLLGPILIASGLIMMRALADRALPYICLGIGCGIFGNGMSGVVVHRATRKNPEILEQIEVEKNDERNITVSNHAKAKSYDLMIYIFGALILSFAWIGIDLMAILLLVAAYLFVVFSGIYYRCKYEKEK